MNEEALNNLIRERNKTHGKWQTQLGCAKIIYDAMLAGYHRWCQDNNKKPSKTAECAVFFMAGKISRMLIGNPLEEEHMKDYQNYLRFYNETRGDYDVRN